VVFGKSDGWGLLSLYSVPKPSYRAFQLLHETGRERYKPQGETYPTVGSLATTNQSHIHLLVWNHDIPTNPLTTQTVCVSLSPVMTGYNKPATIRRIDENNTNPMTAWQQMGSPVYPTPSQIMQLLEASRMREAPFQYTMKGNMLVATVDVPPQGVVSIVFPL